MRVLITGGAGFIGRHLKAHLECSGHEVRICDVETWGQLVSVLDYEQLEPFVAWADQIYHLAASVGVRRIIENPIQTIETNVTGTENVLRCAEGKPVFIASTSEVYGKSDKVPFKETDDLQIGYKSRWAYACSKAMDEFLALAYWKEKKQPVVIGRLFNTVGPGQSGRYGMVLPNFIRQAKAGEPITVFGDGSQTRCFCYVGDVVKAIVKLMEAKPWGEIFNIGSTEEVSISTLARMVKVMSSSQSPVVNVPYSQAYECGFEDIQRRVPDISKIREAIGWQPELRLEQIIERML